MSDFSLNSVGGTQQDTSTLSGGGSSTTFQGSAGVSGQSSGSTAQGGTDYAKMAAAEAAQGFMGTGVSMDALNKLTGGMIQGYVDRQKKEQYAQGMGMAAQGQSLDTIESDQPWYTKLYGPDATTQGAQMFNVNAAQNDAQTSFMQAMPQLREKSPDQVRQYLVGKMASVQSTGDAMTDAMVQQKLAEQMPQMLDTHMQQYMQYTQEQNYNGFTNMATSAARSMQATLSAGNNVSDTDIAAAHTNYAQQIAQPPNMDTDSYQRALRDATVSNALNGNWQAVRAIQQVPAYQSMDAQMKSELDTKIPLLEAQAAAKNPAYAQSADTAEQLRFNMTSGYSPYPSTPAGHAAAMAAMQNLNDQSKLQYGDATVPFTPEKMAEALKGMDAGNQRTYLAGLRSQQANGLKQLQYNESATMFTNAWTSNTPKALDGLPINKLASVSSMNQMYQDATINGPDSTQGQSFWQHASANATSPDMLVPKLQGYINNIMPSFKSGTGPATPDQQQMLLTAQRLQAGPGGEQAVKAYFGDSADDVLAINASHVDVTNPEQFANIRTQLQRGHLAVATTADKQAAAQYVNGQAGTWWNPFSGGALSGWQISDQNKANLSEQIAPTMAQKMKLGLDQPTAAKLAFQEVAGDSVMVPGALVPANGTRWGSDGWSSNVAKVPGAISAQTSSTYQDVFKGYLNDLVTQRVRDSGVPDTHFNPNDYHVAFGTYLGGGHMNLQYSRDGTGEWLSVTANANDFGQRLAKEIAAHARGNGSDTLNPAIDALTMGLGN